MDRLFERPTNRHDLSDTLLATTRQPTHTMELLQIPPRDFHDDVVKTWFKTCRRSDLRDRILDLVERDAETELCGDEREWVAGGFGGEGRLAGETSVDL